MRISNVSLLGLCIALAACQSPTPNTGNPTGAPQLQVGAGLAAAQSAQLLQPSNFMPAAERVQLTSKALQVVDREGKVLAQMQGKFDTLDHRGDAAGLLVATLDKKRQQALLMRLDKTLQWSAPHYLPKTTFAIEGLCLYRDSARNDFMFVVGEGGVGEQWLVGNAGQPAAAPRKVRTLSLPPDSGFCQVDDRSDSLFVNEESVGVWRYEAGAEAPLHREPIDMRAPFGGLAKAAAGMAALPGGLLLLDPEDSALHLYRRDADQWQRAGTFALPGLKEPEQISARASRTGVDLLITDDNGVRPATLGWTPAPIALEPQVAQIAPLAQTDVVPSMGDAADDPAIWVNPRNPEQSRVLGTDKKGGLLVYDLSGRQVQDLRVGRLNNVDIRSGFRLAGKQVDVAVASNRDHNSLHLFAIDPADGRVSEIGEVATPLPEIYGLCMFKDRQGAIFAIVNDKDGRFLQYRLDGSKGKADGQLVRSFQTASQPEGCVADDASERLYVGEEDVAVWTLGARADASTRLEKVIDVGGPLQDDIEGLAVYNGKQRDYLVISSQGNSRYVVVEAKAPYTLRGSFQIGLNAAAGIDGASETDGLEVTSANLGGPWSQGMLVVQDGRKRMPEGNQNYKYVPWAAIAQALGLD